MTLKLITNSCRFAVALVALGLVALGLVACTGDNLATTTIDPPPTGNFSLSSSTRVVNLVEGDPVGVDIALALTRANGHDNIVQLSIEGASAHDSGFITSSFTRGDLSPAADSSQLNLRLDIGDLPLMPQQRSFVVRATDGNATHQVTITANVQPTDAPDVYLLVGQSNMVGFSGDGTKQAYDGGPDQPDPRVYQLNGRENQGNIFSSARDFTSPDQNVVNPYIVQAEDPLHIPLDPNDEDSKELAYIGLGLSFAKAALNNTSSNVILVPAAWSGSAFCSNDDGPLGQWNADPTTDPALGNTWLFDRAVTRADLALAQSDGVLRGILWHQGESDANERCADSYAANLQHLAANLRMRIAPDRRGADMRTADSNIPFVVGTMSRGIDDRGNLADYSVAKQKIDLAHRDLPNQLRHSGVSNHDDLVPANGYPCGNTTCVHFGAEALRVMGQRYLDALRQAVATP
jgi:hypothetical protein